MTLQEIKQRLTMAQLLSYYGFKPDKYLRMCCPFHNDKTPSLQVYYKTQTCYCFSSNCKTHGRAMDVIDFIMYKENCTKAEAIQKARTMTGDNASTPNTTNASTNATVSTTKPTISREQFLQNMFTYFKNAVHNSPAAREYLQSRHIDYKKTEVGYNAGQFHHGTRKDEVMINGCLAYGLLLDLGLKARTGDVAYKPFGKWCICFALRNAKNEIVSLYFRSTLNDKEQRHYYLRDRQGLYPCYPKATAKKLILTESIIDAVTLLQQEAISSHYEILSLYGTNGLTEEHQRAIKDLQELEEIIFFLNGDEVGNKAVAKYALMFKAAYPNIKITNVAVPQSEDVNSLLQGHSAEILTHLIETRKAFDFIVQMEVKKETSEAKLFVQSPESIDNTATQEEVKQPQATGLNTVNPYNLQYKGIEALYQIKGFKIEQPDSLKITLQIVVS